MTFSGISLKTTEPFETIEFFPIVTPLQILTLDPIKTFSCISTGFERCFPEFLSLGKTPWKSESIIYTFVPKSTKSWIIIEDASHIMHKPLFAIILFPKTTLEPGLLASM